MAMFAMTIATTKEQEVRIAPMIEVKSETFNVCAFLNRYFSSLVTSNAVASVVMCSGGQSARFYKAVTQCHLLLITDFIKTKLHL